ncbi:uncharacterized protein [Miscanthus floridulus]|uniref:uncharacterized protein n=1 Tax=Miscanthus floridulus TaxID=154761 RepID=UPI003459E727
MTSPAPPFLRLSPCPPPPDLEGRLPGRLHEEGHAGCLPPRREPPSAPLLPPARTAAPPALAPPLSRSAPAPAFTGGDPAPTARPSSHRRTAAAPTGSRAPTNAFSLPPEHKEDEQVSRQDQACDIVLFDEKLVFPSKHRQEVDPPSPAVGALSRSAPMERNILLQEK